MTTHLRPLLPENWRLPEKEAFLADMREAVQGNEQGESYPGYPTAEGRLHVVAGELAYTPDGRPVFPADPSARYSVFEHSVNPPGPRSGNAFHDNGGPLPPEEASTIHWGDMSRDSRGFPLHRYATDMATDPDIGVIIGPGYCDHPGKKMTVDLGATAVGLPLEERANRHDATLAVRTTLRDHLTIKGSYLSILAVRRQDTKQWALPGGEIEPGEDAEAAALRETREETGIEFDSVFSLGRRIVADPRLTSCTETESELFVVDAGEIPSKKPVGGDDAESSSWLIADRNLFVSRRFFGSHRRMFMEVVDWYQNRHNVTVMENGLIIPN